MSASTVTELVTEELGREYKATLLQIKRNLTNDLQEELCFYYTADPAHAETTGILNLFRHCFRSLENVRKISWEDVGLVKNGFHAVLRLDLVEILTRFAKKRDLSELVHSCDGLSLSVKLRDQTQITHEALITQHSV